MKAISRNSQLAIALSLVAALAVLLVAWLVPLPSLELGVEAQSATRMPQTRADVSSAESAFEQAQTSYKSYIASHDVGAALNNLESAVAAATADPGSASAVAALKTSTQAVTDYTPQLYAYASAGEAYFNQVKHYDDELMSWTRSLGANSEALRPDTWPIVEYLKLYPAPTGEKADYTGITSADVRDVQSTLTTLAQSSINSDTIAQYTAAIAKVREAGRSVEYIESLHAQYLAILKGYDTKLQAVASGSLDGSVSNSRTLFATGANLLLGAAVLAGLVALFIPRLRTKKEVAL